MRRPMQVDVIRQFKAKFAVGVHEFSHGDRDKGHFFLRASTLWDCGALIAMTPIKALMDIFRERPLVLTITATSVRVPNLVELAREAIHLRNCLSYEDRDWLSTGDMWRYGLLTREASYSMWKTPVEVELAFAADRLGSVTITLDRAELRHVRSPWLILGLLSVDDPVVRHVTTTIADTIDEIINKKLI